MAEINPQNGRSSLLWSIAAAFGLGGGAIIGILATPATVPLLVSVWTVLFCAIVSAFLVRISMLVTGRTLARRLLDWPLVILLLVVWLAAGASLAGSFSEGNSLAAMTGGVVLSAPNAVIAVRRRPEIQTLRRNPLAPSVVFASQARQFDDRLREMGFGEGTVSGVMTFATAAFLARWAWTGLALFGLALLLLGLQCFTAIADRAWSRLLAKWQSAKGIFAGFCAGAGVIMVLFTTLVEAGIIDGTLFLPHSNSSRNVLALWLLPSLVACAVAAAVAKRLPLSNKRIAAILATGTLLGAFGSYHFLKDLNVSIQGPSPIPFMGLLPAIFFSVAVVRLEATAAQRLVLPEST